MGLDADRVKAAGSWAVRVASARPAVVCRMRGRDDVTMLRAADGIWLRGASTEVALLRLLDSLPGGERFEVDGDGRCRIPGHRLPVATVPDGAWLSVREVFAVELPPAALPGRVSRQVRLRLVRGGAVADGNLLRTGLRDLAAWIDRAAAVRFKGLRFAACDDGQALVHGRPLPPLPGEVAVECGRVAVAAGFRLEPDVPLALAASVMNLQPGDLAWFAADGSCTIVPGERFVALRRSAVRASLREVDNDG